MMYWGNGMGGWGMAMMTVSSLLFWGLIIVGIVVLVRYVGRSGHPAPPVSERPTPQQKLADRAAFWLVLVALVGGGLTLAVWLLAGESFATAMLFAITVVVITCPDALGLATPTAIMVGTGLGAKRGVLYKNAIALETSARIQVVVMDKTGTLTKGEPEVTDVIVADGVAEG